ncbi:hypothetical protein Aperf_G00000011403 [Anoplocephala perfoliata]
MTDLRIVPQEQPAGLNPETLSTSGTSNPLGPRGLQSETVWDPEWDCTPIFVPPIVVEAQMFARLEAARLSKLLANNLRGVNTGTSPTLAAQIPLDQQNFDDQSQRGGILHSDAKHPTLDNYQPSYPRTENAIPTITHHDDGKQPFEIKGGLGCDEDLARRHYIGLDYPNHGQMPYLFQKPCQSSGAINNDADLDYRSYRALPTPNVGNLQKKSLIQHTDSNSKKNLLEPQARKNIRYKTELCRYLQRTGKCPHGSRCTFAHGVFELRNIEEHPNYKRVPCRNMLRTGTCPYGDKCTFIH